MTTPTTTTLRAVLVLMLVTVAPALQGCSHAMMMMRGTGARRPAATEFGLGPRSSAAGRFVATLEPAQPLRPRQMQIVRVVVRDAAGRAIDGGMPEHGHGLPTRPRMTRALGDGLYEIEGVRFNMGGWWEFRLAITSAHGVDTVTFNLAL